MKAILILALFAAVGTCLPAPSSYDYDRNKGYDKGEHNNPQHTHVRYDRSVHDSDKSKPVSVAARPVRAAPATLKSKDDLDAAGFFYGLYGYGGYGGYGYGYGYPYSRFGYGYGYPYSYYGIYG